MFSNLIPKQIMHCDESQTKYYLHKTPRRTKEMEPSNAKAIRDTGIRQTPVPLYFATSQRRWLPSGVQSHSTGSQIKGCVLICLYLLWCECGHVMFARASIAIKDPHKQWFANKLNWDIESLNVPEEMPTEKPTFQPIYITPQRLIG